MDKAQSYPDFLKAQRETLEADIRSAINVFEKNTGVVVTGISIARNISPPEIQHYHTDISYKVG